MFGNGADHGRDEEGARGCSEDVEGREKRGKGRYHGGGGDSGNMADSFEVAK